MASPINEYSITSKFYWNYDNLRYNPGIIVKDLKVLTHVSPPTPTELWIIECYIVNRIFFSVELSKKTVLRMTFYQKKI